MARRFEQQWRDDALHFGASRHGVARHIVPAQWIGQYQTCNNDHYGNYRMGSRFSNGTDSSIDNMFRSGYFDTGGRSDGRYISNDRAYSRMMQQLDSMSAMAQPSRRHLRSMYLAAHDIPGSDLRAFNGFRFDRR
jgi:hypothetical protein